LRRISTKLVVAVLAAVILPFVAFAVFLDVQIAERVTRRVAQQALLGLAKDLGGQLDLFVEERGRDVTQWAGAPFTQDAVGDRLLEEARLRKQQRGENGGAPPPVRWDAALLERATRGDLSHPFDHADHWKRWLLSRELNRYVELKGIYDLVLVVSEDGRLVTCSSRGPDGAPLPLAFLEDLFVRDYTDQEWLGGALAEGTARIDKHVSTFRPEVFEDESHNYHLGFAAAVGDENAAPGQRGVLYALVNWNHIQQAVSTPVVKDAFRGLVEGREPSPYAWIWAADADTILGHIDHGLYGKSVSHDVGLPQMTRAVLDSQADFALYPDYSFRGVDKSAAFTRTANFAKGGFHWVVGVGIDDTDIYATAGSLRRLLLGGTVAVLLVAVLWTFVIARRTTGPILELQRYTRRVARGDLDAQADIRSKDELGDLADDFNVMTRELKSQRAALIKAEKDAAWREMARQIAHDIKNPLTPINLSLDLLERARREQAEGSEEILERTMGLIRRQVEHLRQIAGDFYEFTGGRRPQPEPIELTALLDEVLHLHDAWAVELGVEVQREGEEALVVADLGKLRRVFVNLVSNSLQSMPEGGRLQVATRVEGSAAVCRIRDTGHGLTDEVRERLFEPYFTTKSEGTGLGLAISRRVVEESGGEITLEPAGDGPGTIATVRLPLGPRPTDAIDDGEPA
jgi:signal transduction histidine kinase